MTDGFNLLNNKTILVTGIANDRSIAYGVAKNAFANGAKLILTYPNDKVKKRVMNAAKEFGNAPIIEYDVSSEENLEKFSNDLDQITDTLDGAVHSIAFADKECLQGTVTEISKTQFLQAMDISCYSLIQLSSILLNWLDKKDKLIDINKDGTTEKQQKDFSIIAMTYLGASKVIPNYNIMGICKAALESSVRYLATDLGRYNIRVNAVSAGPIKTAAALAINNFSFITKWNQYNSPLQRNVTTDDVGKVTAFLLSNLSSCITGEIMFADAGYNINGMLNKNSLEKISSLIKEYDPQ